MLAFGVVGIVVGIVVLMMLARWVRDRVVKVELPATVSGFIEGVRSKRIPVSRDSLLQMTVVNSAIPGTKTFLGEPLSDEQTDAASASLREIYEARYGAVDVDAYGAVKETFDDFDPCAGGTPDEGYVFKYNAATNMCDQIPIETPSYILPDICEEGKTWDDARAKCVWKKDTDWQKQTDCEQRGKFWDHDANAGAGKCMVVTPEREARKADPAYQTKRKMVEIGGKIVVGLSGNAGKEAMLGSFQNQLVAAGYTWKNGKLCSGNECYATWDLKDYERAKKTGVVKAGLVKIDPWGVDAKPLNTVIRNNAKKMGYTTYGWYRNGQRGPAYGMLCKPWPKGQDPDKKNCKWESELAKEWSNVVATRGAAAAGKIDEALVTSTGPGLYPGAAQLGRTEWGWGKNAGKACKKGQKDCLSAAQVKTQFQDLVKRNVASTGKASGGGCSYPGAFELGYTRWGYPKEGGGNVCCNANNKCLNRGQIEKARASTAGSVSTRKYFCYKDGKPFEYKNVDVNWAGGAGDAAWACNKKFPSCGGKCTSDPKSAKVLIPAKSFCTWDNKDQTSAGWYKVGGNCCLKNSCTCRNMGNGKTFPTTDATHNGGKCAKKGAAAKTPAAKAPAAAKTPAKKGAAAYCTWGGKDQSADFVQVGKNCCSKKSCYCRDMKTGGGYQTTDAGYRGGACKKGASTAKAPAAKAKAPAAKAPAAAKKAFCHWGGKDQNAYVKFGDKCCSKNGCWCVDPTTGANGYATQDKRHNNGKCANTLANAAALAVAQIDARNKKAAADKAAADKRAADKEAADKAARKAAEKEKLRARAGEWN